VAQWRTKNGIRRAPADNSGPRVRVVALSAGPSHFRDGNPGTEANVSRLVSFAQQSRAEAPDLIVFPEMATVGWPFPSAEEVRRNAEQIPGAGSCYQRYVELARVCHAVVCGWLIEKDSDGCCYNTSFLVARDGAFIGKYRKIHPTAAEAGQWGTRPGTEIPVFDLGFVKVGICVCLDMSFPEVCRSILLRGGELILHPTLANDRRDTCPVRCKENILPMVVAVFQDSSYALDAFGGIVADLHGDGGALVCDMYPHAGNRLEKYGFLRDPRATILALRRPEAYGPITDPTLVARWRDVFETREGRPLTEQELRAVFPHFDV